MSENLNYYSVLLPAQTKINLQEEAKSRSPTNGSWVDMLMAGYILVRSLHLCIFNVRGQPE